MNTGQLDRRYLIGLKAPYTWVVGANPLSIMLFSENAQELKVIDQNLNEIQKVDFRLNFGFIKAA